MVTAGNNVLNIWACMQKHINGLIDKTARRRAKPPLSQKASLKPCCRAQYKTHTARQAVALEVIILLYQPCTQLQKAVRTSL